MLSGTDEALMNEKEKNYVAYCFSRLAGQKSSSIDFGQVLAGNKITYDLRSTKQEVIIKFGKIVKRSKKWIRPSVGTETTFLEDRMILSELFEMLSILKCIVLDDENIEAMEDAIYTRFYEEFSKIINKSKTFLFLTELFDQCSKKMKNKILDLLVENVDIITEIEGLAEFLGPVALEITECQELKFNKLWRTTSGYVIGLCFLDNHSFIEPISASFIDSDILVVNYFSEFIEKIACSTAGTENFYKIQKKLAMLKEPRVDELIGKFFY
ncbi:hypothetical protein PAEPH01_1934 [Pancytospora epiphaga]|nr:hypothetical protein PAEPH01_1934 [Pancytospora epiphaga]